MKIHVIQTGTVVIKTAQVEGVGHGSRRLLNMLLDRKWTSPFPIYAFAIEHPEGVIVIDTGETARTAEPGYFPRWNPYYRFGIQLSVKPEEEIGPQLERLGIPPSEVRWLVLTHLHTDHAGGLHHFPKTQILVSSAEVRQAAGRAGRLRGYVNQRFPKWFDPAGIDFPSNPLGPFPESRLLTKAGDVSLVPLPGHTAGHLGVVLQEADHSVFFAGDASYSQSLLLRGVVDGVAPDEEAYRVSQSRIRAYAVSTPTVYLVAHDPETKARLVARGLVTPI